MKSPNSPSRTRGRRGKRIVKGSASHSVANDGVVVSSSAASGNSPIVNGKNSIKPQAVVSNSPTQSPKKEVTTLDNETVVPPVTHAELSKALDELKNDISNKIISNVDDMMDYIREESRKTRSFLGFILNRKLPSLLNGITQEFSDEMRENINSDIIRVSNLQKIELKLLKASVDELSEKLEQLLEKEIPPEVQPEAQPQETARAQNEPDAQQNVQPAENVAL